MRHYLNGNGRTDTYVDLQKKWTQLDIYRIPTKNGNTFGELLVDGNDFCDTCEDEIRDPWVKIYQKTCIPAITYHVDVTYSPRFNKLLPVIYTETDKNTIIYETKDPDGNEVEIEFVGVRFHGGKDHLHSAGCPLVGYGVSGQQLLNGLKASTDITRLIMEILGYDPIWDEKSSWWIKGENKKEGLEVKLTIHNP